MELVELAPCWMLVQHLHHEEVQGLVVSLHLRHGWCSRRRQRNLLGIVCFGPWTVSQGFPYMVGN